MPKRSTITPSRAEGRRVSQWKIDLPASLSPTGKRQRYFFKTKQDALNFGDEQRTRIDNYGTAGMTGLSPSQLEQAALAFDSIKPYSVSLNEVVQDWVARRKAREKTVTFAVGFDQYLKHLAVKKKNGRPISEEYRRQTKYCLNRFPSLHDVPLTEIDDGMVATGAKDMTPAMKNAFLRILNAFFAWCGKAPRGWLKSNPATKDKIERESLGKKEVEIYQPDEVKRILAVAPDNLLPLYLFGFFGGIRPWELPRMDWSHLNLEEKHIVLPALETKGGKRRVITVEATLASWLTWYFSKCGIQQGPVVNPINLRKRLKAVRTAAKVKNIQDGLRHSYASYWLAEFKDEHKLRENLGHKSASELWDHYHKQTTEKEAKDFWAVLPPKKKQKKIVPFKREQAA